MSIKVLRRSRQSLRTKIIAWSLVPTAIISVVVAWATFNAYQRVTEELVIERDLELTRLTATELSRELREYVDLLSILARNENTYEGDLINKNVILKQANNIIEPRLSPTGVAYLVDVNGRVIYHSKPEHIGDLVSDQVIVQEVLEGKRGIVRTRNAEGQEIVSSFTPVPSTDWGLITEESWQALIQSSQGYRRALLWLLILGVLAPAVAITIGVRRITQPITALINAAQEIAGGNFNQTIIASTGDELEEMAIQFNRMAAQLQASYENLEQKVADRTRELAALNAIAASVNESLDLDQTLNRALDELMRLLDLEVGEIRLLDQERKALVIRTHHGLSSEFIQQADRLIVDETLQGQVLLSGQSIIQERVSGHLAQTWACQKGVQAIVICPLQAKDKQLGTLSLATCRGPRPFSQNERELLRAASDQVSMAIENARLFEIEKRRAEQFQVISEVGQRIASILAVDELLQEIVYLVQENLGYYMVGIGLVEGNEIVIQAGAGRLREIMDFEPVHLKLDDVGIISWVARTGKPLIVSDVTQESRYHLLPQANKTRSELAVPMKTKKSTIGVLDVQSDHLNAFDEKDLAVLQSLAHQAAIAIENARLYQQARQLAIMEERNRLARDLHDAVSQSLYGVTLFAEAAERLLSENQVDLAIEHLQELQHTAQEALQEMRLLIFELRPPILGNNGLAAALQVRLETVEGRAGLKTTFETQGADKRLSPEIEQGLYRIAQEALNNTLRHAQAHHVNVRLRQDQSTVTLEIIDDGIGFDPTKARQQGGFGLKGMKERALQLGVKLSIQGRLGKGTQVKVEVTP